MEVILLHNEKAGNGSWPRKELLKAVRRGGYEPRYVPLRLGLENPGMLDRGEFVIIAGGDGAIRKAALALLDRGRPIAPLPLGTANNIVRSFGLHGTPEEIIAGWQAPKLRPFDVGVAEGPWGKRHFVEGIGIGLISRSIAVIDEIDDISIYRLKKARHKLYRDVCVATALAHEMHPLHAQVSFDGRDLREKFLLLEILNIRRAGPGLELAPQASPSDGRFDVVSVTESQRERLIHTLKARLTDTKRIRSLTTRRTREVHLHIAAPCEMRLDDGAFRVEADTDVEITMKPGALEFVLPGDPSPQEAARKSKKGKEPAGNS
jgi:diacylglycerol kinase family enzyme